MRDDGQDTTRRDLVLAGVIIAAMATVFIGSWIDSQPPTDEGHTVLVRNEHATPVLVHVDGEDADAWVEVPPFSVVAVSLKKKSGPVVGLWFDCNEDHGVLFSGESDGDAWSDLAVIVPFMENGATGLVRPKDLERYHPSPLPEVEARPVPPCQP